MKKQTLSQASDTSSNLVNNINLETLNETINQVKKDPALGQCHFKAKNTWVKGTHNCSSFNTFFAAKQTIAHKQKFEMHADEPNMLAGEDAAANPVEYLLHALASCLTTSLIAHAAVRQISIESLESEIEGDIDLNGFFGLNPNTPKGFSEIRISFKVKTSNGDLAVLKSLTEFSPVFNTLIQGTKVKVKLEEK
jgi:uncharacterized OsmC-like protein